MPCSPPTIPLPAQTMPDLRFPPFPESRSALGVRGGPLVALAALLAGAVALSAIAVFGDGWPALWIPAGLALVALATYALLWSALVRPVRRFAAAMARMAAEDRVDLVPRARVVELDRVALALYRFRRIRPGRRGTRSRHRVPLAVTLGLVAALVLGWAIPAAVATVGGAVPQTEAVVRDAGASAAVQADELHGALRGGLAAVERAAALPTGAAVTDPATTASQVLAVEPLFRSVTVVDASGQPVVTAGASPSAAIEVPPGGARVVQANSAGSEPLVRASSPMWDGASALVAEFDPRALNALIRGSGGRTRVVDGQRATVLDSRGYTAFAPLDDPALRALAAAAVGDTPAVDTPDDGRVAAAQRVTAPGTATDLGWVLVEDRNLAAAAFAGDGNRRAALVAIVAAAGLACAALAWTAVTTVVPARRLARHVERLAAGETLPPLAPQRLDEIGTAVEATNRLAATRTVRPVHGLRVART
ncbi:HAMP domain-containing protein [Pseudonocardia sp. DSM 110487]|uniref:HAMP domain-containing protein n=1 Tax=Pseudonocardia sp. DSM 110487 TaxID=2865833 RepID=UPI002105B99C|nr:HAMP domain-containing protein [Pseudonocardia sp. DSM 110487]